MVVLEHHPVAQVASMVGTAARSDGRLLQRAQARGRLAGVPHPRATARRRDERSGDRGDAGQVAEEVERRPLAGEDRRERSGEDIAHTAPAATTPLRQPARTLEAASTWRKVSSTHARPATTPGVRATICPDAYAPGGSRAEVRSPSGVRSSPIAKRDHSVDGTDRRIAQRHAAQPVSLRRLPCPDARRTRRFWSTDVVAIEKNSQF